MAATMAAAVLCGVLIVYCLLRCVLPEELNRFLSSEPEPAAAAPKPKAERKKKSRKAD